MCKCKIVTGILIKTSVLERDVCKDMYSNNIDCKICLLYDDGADRNGDDLIQTMQVSKRWHIQNRICSSPPTTIYILLLPLPQLTSI